MSASKPAERNRKPAFERLWQLAWAALIAAVLNMATMLAPVDEMLWSIQDPYAEFPASGEIVFVGADKDITDPDFPERREELARMIEQLDRAGANEIFVDMVFDRASEPEADAALNAAMRNTTRRTVLVDSVRTGIDGGDVLVETLPAVGENVPRSASRIWTNLYGQAWYMFYSVPLANETRPMFAVELAGEDTIGAGLFPISYYFALSSIPIFRYEILSENPQLANGLAGKKIVIGLTNPPGVTRPNIPGLAGVPPSVISIFAAETLTSGHTLQEDGLLTLACLAILLVAAAFLRAGPQRYTAYALTIILTPVTFYALAQWAIRLNGGAALAFVVIFFILRARSVWKRNFRMVDEDTNLPTFAALEASREVADTSPTIIIARIHRFEEVRRTLPRELHAEYLLRIIARLRAATQETTIHLGQGHLLAWTMAERDPELLRAHLEGLRALFGAPLQVGTHSVDVGITFGLDTSNSANVTRRIAAAVSASEHSTETYDPIIIADSASDEELIWNISLQARIDAALANGEIFLVYQPKVSVNSGNLQGVEALVRWNDPARGLIPPDKFISQCENAGRMSHLTRHVLREGCKAGNAFERHGLIFPVAVNISATLLHDRQIVRMVTDVLEETGYDPARLVLEITETYRIANFERAAGILRELAALGLKISMDDFGIGAASLEALQRLPFDEIKIDRQFVGQMLGDEKSRGIVRSIITLGRELRLTVVAEGVEDAQTFAILRDSGCQLAQGFGISHPVSFDDILLFQHFGKMRELRGMV